MRPIRLAVEGLRSLRRRVEIDFENRRLLAIVGDTGVGKSSLLEAVTYALYGSSTWTALDRELISDTSALMHVELTFAACHKTYTVTRLSSQADGVRSAKLLCHDDGRTWTNTRSVDRQIEDLIGLDRAAFLKTVILPQGRFAELLTSTRAERNHVLRNIFDIDAVDTVQALTRETRDRTASRLAETKRRLAMLPADPTTMLERARARREEATTRTTCLTGALEEAASHEKARSEAGSRSDTLQDIIAGLRKIDTDGIRAELEQVARRERSLFADRGRMEERQAACSARVDELAERRAADASLGLDLKELAAVRTKLEALVENVADLSRDLAQLAADTDSLAADEQAIGLQRTAAETARAEAAEAERAVQEAGAQLRESEARLGEAEALLRRTEEVTARRERAERRFSDAMRSLASARERMASAEEEEARAIEWLARADRDHQAAVQAHAVSHAAEGSRPGDPCPVCSRALPSDFRRPTASGLVQARAQRLEAEQASDAAHATTTELRQVIRAATDEVAAAKRKLTTSERAEVDARKTILRALGGGRVYLSMPPAKIISSVLSEQEKARSEHSSARRAADLASKATAEAEAALARLRVRVDERQKSARRHRKHCARQLYKVRRSVESLPSDLRPDLGDLSGPERVDRSTLVGPRVATALDAVTERLQQLERLEEELSVARAELEDAWRQTDEANDRIGEEVTARRETLSAQLHNVAATLTSLERRFGMQSGQIRIPAEDFERSLEAIAAHRQQLLDQSEAELRDRARREDDARARLQRLLTVHDVGCLDDLSVALQEAKEERRNAELDSERYLVEIDAKRELEVKLRADAELVHDLEELDRALSTFGADVLRRRSQALLAVASGRLEVLTGGHFAFTRNFDVLDQLTGQPRRADALSGGERFLASLSLALGMVDLAARFGGDVDALFLDEGFGALDNANLTAALDALEATARDGRMVAVISHLKAVAERIDDVMLVIGKPEGTEAVWLEDVERSGVSEYDLSTAIRGLLE